MQISTAINIPNWSMITGRVSGAISSLFLDFTATDTLDERVTFNRTSNATVTRSDGTIGFAPHNLVTFSEQFDNAAWAKTTTTITANDAVAPNGTTTADRLQATGADSTTLQAFTAINGTYTFSVYLRRVSGIGGVAISAGAGFGARTITSSWQRYSVTSTLTAGSVSAGLRLATSGAVIEMWGAQLEISPSATTYNPTTVKNLLGFSELFDNAAWTKSNSFIQTNLVTFSEAFDNAAWIKTNSTVTANSEIAPNGYQTADTHTATATTNVHISRPNVATLINGQTYTASRYVKAGSKSFCTIGLFGLADAYFNLDLLTHSFVGTGAVSASIVDVGNGWRRITATWTWGAGTNYTLFFAIASSLSSMAGITIGDTIYVWGAQVVQGSVAGDYRRTDATVLPIYYPNQDGVVVAEKLVENTETGAHGVTQNVTATAFIPYTYSIYAKQGERTKFVVWLRGASSGNRVQVGFDLNNGTSFGLSSLGNFTNGLATITPVGNEWYRCSVTGTTGSGETLVQGNAYLLDNVATVSTFSYTGDGTSGIYIFGAQLSDSASLDPYVLNAGAAPAAQAYFGARFDYDPVTLQPKGLLIEEQRSNLATYSEEFDNAVWSKTNVTVTANTSTAPNGTLTADSLTGNGVLANRYLQLTRTAFASTQTIYFYAKADTNSFVQIYFGVDTSPFANFDLSTGTVGTVGTAITASMVDAGNGWYRCISVLTSTTATNVRISLVTSATAVRAESNTISTGIFIWGAQLETGAFATSYIPTQASQVTRAADNATIVGSNFASFYNQNEGSVFVNAVSNGISSGGTSTFWSISDNTLNNRIRFNSGGGAFEVNANGINQATVTNLYTLGTFAKVASAFSTNSFNSAINSTLGIEDTSGITPIVNQMQLGNLLTQRDLNGTIKQISYYNRRLSNSELQALTS